MLRFEQVTFRFDESPETSSILEEVSFSLEFGETLVLIGPCGSGKTTLAHLMAGVMEPTSGQIIRNQETDPPDRPFVALLQQNVEHQLVGTTVEEELVFGLECLAVPPAEIGERLESLREFLRISDWSNRSVEQLSDGEKQRLALAGILLPRPRLLILDEPTATLDPWAKVDFHRQLAVIRREFPCTLVLITQDLSEVVHADRLLLLEKGRIRFLGTPTAAAMQFSSLPNDGPLFYQELALHCSLSLPPSPAIRSCADLPSSCPAVPPKVGAGASPPVSLHLQSVGLAIAGKTILEDVSLELNAGAIHVLVGRSGSGKTLLLEAIAGFRPLSHGEIRFSGLSAPDSSLSPVGMVFHNPERIFFCSTVHEEFLFPLRRCGFPAPEAEIRSRKWAHAWGIEPEEAFPRRPLSLSGGEQRRTALAASTVLERPVLLFDEPFNHLAVDDVEAARIKLRELARNHLVIVVTHTPEFLFDGVSRIIRLNEGHCQAFDTPREFLSTLWTENHPFPFPYPFLTGSSGDDAAGAASPTPRRPPPGYSFLPFPHRRALLSFQRG